MSRRWKYYQVYGTSAGNIVMQDPSLPYLSDVFDRFPEQMFRALAGTASDVAKLIKKEVRAGAPGGAKFAPLQKVKGFKRKKGFSQISLRHGKSNTKPYQNLVRAVGYNAVRNGYFARIGWLSKSSVRLGQRLQEG